MATEVKNEEKKATAEATVEPVADAITEKLPTPDNNANEPHTEAGQEPAAAENLEPEPRAQASGEHVTPDIHPEVSEAGVTAVAEPEHSGLSQTGAVVVGETNRPTEPTGAIRFTDKPEAAILNMPKEFKTGPIENSGRWKGVTQWLHALKKQFIAGKSSSEAPSNVVPFQQNQTGQEQKKAA